MENTNNPNNENINSNANPLDLVKQLIKEQTTAFRAEEQAQIEKQRFEEDRKRIEEEKNRFEEQKRLLEENSKKLYDDVKTKIPRIDTLANRFKENSDLQDGVAFLSSLSSLIENEEFTAEELTNIVRNQMTDDDFAKFKSNDDASKITYKLMKICGKYQKPQETPAPIQEKTRAIPTNSTNRNEPEQPLLRRDPSSYQNAMFTSTEDIKDFLQIYDRKK
jgi:hypothetical protein